MKLNGETGHCQCGMAGYGYCKPELSTSVFEDYWDTCSENSSEILQTTLDYWMKFQQFYVYRVSQIS
jgi:hypothetical protein